MRWNTILVAHDFSQSAEHATDIACHEARIHGARVVILHVVELLPHFGHETSMMTIPGTSTQISVLRYHMQRAEAELAALVSRLETDGLEVSTVIRNGVPVDEIRDFAATELIDLVVVGTHGRSGIRRLLVGSVAERLVRSSSVPVMTIRHPDASES
ncbi:universal stress protein [soil metagenome]